MIYILDITGEDIAKLNDADLRTLVGLLCEAEYRRYNLSTDKIMWGGHQDAPDGGLDVIINDTDAQAVHNGFIPRKFTGFQVKCSAMTTSKIKTEMKPKGLLRDSIKEIIRQKGAYIIIDSQSSLTGKTLEDRIQTMGSCITKEADAANCHLDFYDKGRIATWVRSHPSLIFWVKNKIGSGTTAWKAYGNWANPKAEADEEYILDDKARLHYEGDVLPIIDGIKELSEQLSKSKSSVRLVGLSGVGKTRLVQALFDQRIHKGALSTYEVVYTDISLNPQPSPEPFAHQLVSGGERLILIIDNCSPELHRALTTICSEAASKISLLTIEYDVRDDLPEETEVFKLEPASKDVVLNIIQKQYPDIGHPNAERITEFSDGNARVALYLAKTIDKGDTLSGLSDKALFERLFYQRNDVDKELEKAAEVCSLVYSFDGVGISERSELNILASLIEKTGSWLYGNVQELIRRDLVQSRGNMRAVLPQAIADRLACSALDSIHPTRITECFKNSSERLLISFTHRLSYLHYNQNAVEIAEDWLSEKGYIGKNIDNLNKFGIKLFENLAPVSLKATLEAIERAANGTNKATFLSRENSHHTAFVRILKKLAYEPVLFERSTDLICAFALIENIHENADTVRNILGNLFYLYLSGTKTPLKERVQFIEKYVNSPIIENQLLGIIMLEKALTCMTFISHEDISFGSRKRDYEYELYTNEDVNIWYMGIIRIQEGIAVSESPYREKIRKIFSDSLSELWGIASIRDFLKDTILRIHKQVPWTDLWVTVKNILEFSETDIKQLFELEEKLRPVTLPDRVRVYVLSQDYHGLHQIQELPEGVSHFERAQDYSEFVFSLGKETAKNKDEFSVLLPELVSSSSNMMSDFGFGLAEAYENKEELIEQLYSAFAKAEPNKRNIEIINGVLRSYQKTCPEFTEELLDRFLTDTILSERFPSIQLSLNYDNRAVERLHMALNTKSVQSREFSNLISTNLGRNLKNDELVPLMEKLKTKEDGVNIVFYTIKMKITIDRADQHQQFGELVNFIKDFLCNDYPFGSNNYGHDDYGLSEIVKACFSSKERESDILAIGEVFIEKTKTAYTNNFPRFMHTFAKIHPFIFLGLFTAASKSMHRISYIKGPSAFDTIPSEVIIDWCDIEPEERYPLIASVLTSMVQVDNNFVLNPFFETLFDKAPDINKILNNINIILHPMVYTPPLSEIIKSKLTVFEQLFEYENSAVKEWAKKKHREISEEIQREIAREKDEISRRSETFE